MSRGLLRAAVWVTAIAAAAARTSAHRRRPRPTINRPTHAPQRTRRSGWRSRLSDWVRDSRLGESALRWLFLSASTFWVLLVIVGSLAESFLAEREPDTFSLGLISTFGLLIAIPLFSIAGALAVAKQVTDPQAKATVQVQALFYAATVGMLFLLQGADLPPTAEALRSAGIGGTTFAAFAFAARAVEAVWHARIQGNTRAQSSRQEITGLAQDQPRRPSAPVPRSRSTSAG